MQKTPKKGTIIMVLYEHTLQCLMSATSKREEGQQKTAVVRCLKNTCLEYFTGNSTGKGDSVLCRVGENFILQKIHGQNSSLGNIAHHSCREFIDKETIIYSF